MVQYLLKKRRRRIKQKHQVKKIADKNEEEEEEEEVGYEGDTVCENRKDHNEKIMENMTQTKTKKARWFSIC